MINRIRIDSNQFRRRVYSATPQPTFAVVYRCEVCNRFVVQLILNPALVDSFPNQFVIALKYCRKLF